MRILGVDTATPTASVAIVEEGELVHEEIQRRTLETKDGAAPQPRGNHAEIILPLIQSTLDKVRMTVADLSGIAVSIGPGSFTGLRIGLATVKGIAYDWSLPVVGVSTLLANALRVKNFDGIVCSLLDARKGEVYVGMFRRRGKIVTCLSGETVTPINAAIDLARDYCDPAGGASLFVIGDGTKAYEQLLIGSLGDGVILSAGDDYPSLASRVAELACARISAASVDDLGTLAPVYLRRPEAESKKNSH